MTGQAKKFQKKKKRKKGKKKKKKRKNLYKYVCYMLNKKNKIGQKLSRMKEGG